MAIIPTSRLLYASFGSSHINQGLRNALGRAVVWGAPDAVGTDGRLSLTLVEVHDFALAEACRNGLAWEILSHALEVEEKDAALCIQVALNDPAHPTVLVHEMQNIKHMYCVCLAEASKAGEICLDTIQER